MSNVIKIKRSGTASATPNTLEHGELSINYADGKIYFKNTSDSIVEFTNLAIQATAPTNTNILWADTSVTGTEVLPAGGTTGQMLAKSSGTDYATTWTTPVTFSDLDLKAPLASPTFSGTPTLPTGTIATTQTAADSSTKVATTAFVTTADNLKANLASPTFTGIPAAPTAAVDTNTTQLATTAYVIGQGYAKLASPTFTGTPLVSANFSPSATNSYDLGTSSLRWRNIYTQDLHLSNGIGDYTIVEGKESLYLVNNKTNKSFKFALIEVESSEVPKLSEV